MRIADIPFRQRGAIELLGFDRGVPPGEALGRGPGVAEEFAEFGWTRLETLALSDAAGRVKVIEDALVLALHSPDDWPTDTGDTFMLEFLLAGHPAAGLLAGSPAAERLAGSPAVAAEGLEHGGEPLSVLAPLLRFLDVHAPAIVGRERDIVLALCNPRELVIDVGSDAPSWLGERRIHYGMGDVTAWLDPAPPRIRLEARRWHVTPSSSGGHT